MSSGYEPKDHIERLVVAPRSEGILEQREITIQSYQTTVQFDHAALHSLLEGAWLTPQVRFGVFARVGAAGADAITAVLGLQDELTVRAYDYDARRPLWFSWQDVIVDTVNVHYFKGEDGLLRFTTTGGGRRITDERLHEFNSGFLKIPKEAVSKRHFDLDKLRHLCFDRFADRLYMLRFSDHSGKEYRSIDHALFQSRQYIDPKAERFKEVSSDKQAKIESFDSDISIESDDLVNAIQVRFFIRGLSGSLRLRFPKVVYRAQVNAPEEQAKVFYRLVDTTVSAILDEDYYVPQQRTLDDVCIGEGVLPGFVDLAPFRAILVNATARRKFLVNIDLGEGWREWGPQLQAIDELMEAEEVAQDVNEVLRELTARDPAMAVRLLAVCQADDCKRRVGHMLADVLSSRLQAISSELRGQSEEQLLSWAIEREAESWDLDVASDKFGAIGMKWQIEDVAYDVLPCIIWKLLGVFHDRLTKAVGDVGALLRKYDWCITVAKNFPAHHSKIPAALRLVAEGWIPRTVSEAGRVLKNQVSSVSALDEAVLNQFGLPLWPLLTAVRRNGKVVLANEGIGAALNVKILSENDEPDGKPTTFDLGSGDSVSLPLPSEHAAADVQFEKFSRTYRAAVPIVGEESYAVVLDNHRNLPATVNRKRLSAQREYRKAIDPEGIVVGSSPVLLEIFEHIHHANQIEGLPAVLLLGEPGVGKTHIAKLLHTSSTRASKPFEVVNAGGGGGDINIQRGEWIGYGKNHGIQHIDKNGHPGHLMKAKGGSLFIDEFASFSHDLQVVFLSVLEKRSIQKVGGESFAPDVRCIFATNADVEKAVADGTLRQDLIDRIPIKCRIPPLRDRRGDILLLARHFAGEHEVSAPCLVALLRYCWPGNIRELQSKLAGAVARKKSEEATSIDLPHVDLPSDLIADVEGIDDDACRRELWTLADEIARGEGFEHGTGLQRRAGEIMGVKPSQATKMYQAYDLARAASA